jgi:hypothetical protein
MEETYLSIPLSHGPTAIVASEQDTNGLSHDGDQQLNAQVMIKNLQNMHTLTRSHFCPREREGGWSRSIITGPACKAGDHTRADASS